MTHNYHTHTWRCNHAASDERAYLLAAEAAGITTLGFSDHVPYPFGKDHHSWFRMTTEQTADYVDTLKVLRDEFAGRVEVHIGFEAEYYPTYFGDMLAHLEPFDYEYLILGQHFLYNEAGAPYCSHEFEDVKLLDDYVEQCTRALHTGAFSCFAHPDLIHFEGDEGTYRRTVRRLCREAKACGVPLEMNLLGIRARRHYPREAFWQEAAVVGNQVILGRDAHDPAAFGDAKAEETAMAMVRRCGLHLIDSLTLARPHAGKL